LSHSISGVASSV